MKFRGYIYAFVSAVMYGSIGIFVKSGISESFGPIDLVMLQMIISIVLMLVVCLIWCPKDIRLEKKQLKQLLILGGISNTAILVFNYKSYEYLSVSVATVILYTYPALVAIASTVLFKLKVSVYKVIAIGGSFFGCLLIINIFSPTVLASISVLGLVYASLAAVSFAFFNLYATKILHGTKPAVVTLYNAVFTLLVLLVFNFGFVFKLPDVTMEILTHTTLLAVVCGIAPSMLFYFALKHIGSIPVSIIGSLEIPIAALLSWLLLKDSLTAVQILGVVVSVVSVILLKFEPEETVKA